MLKIFGKNLVNVIYADKFFIISLLFKKKIKSILILDLAVGFGKYKPVLQTITQKVEEPSFIEGETFHEEN